ncbi:MULTISPECIES: LOG family protein [Edaphocola]|jgi:uncharacterized protein (TIGR00730 family)|uniref:LOG family protein n=1 Tax=Edaphocola TaxID=2601681 RepID=UPI00100A7B16|nr:MULTISPECIES: TIGR00730 family Rossman fold protein [Edaphocola]
MNITSIAVFCGSSSGAETVYAQQAYALGKTLAAQGLQLIYGGAKVGLMGAVADGVMDEGGQAIGVIPQFLRTKEIAHEGLTDLILVDTMHERKTKMHELSDGIITLPGGFGTMEELFEMLTWAQLGLHRKPMGLLNVQGFYDPLLAMADAMMHQGFLSKQNRDMLIADEHIDTLLQQMRNYEAPEVGKWLDKDRT